MDNTGLASAAAVKRYRCSDLISFPAGHGSALIYNRTNQRSIVLPDFDLELLNRCNIFKTLDEHAQALASELDNDRLISELSTQPAFAPVGRFLKRFRDFAQKQGVSFEDQSKTAGIKQKLQAFADAGLLISDNDVLAKRELPSDAADRILTIGLLTRNRPELLRLCLTSYIENCNRHSKKVEFIVVDDSEQPTVREATRGMLGSLAQKYGRRIVYAGFEEKRKYSEQLIAAGNLTPEVVNFALFDVEGCGHTVGANRNALLLHTVGDMFFSADDDTVCHLANAPQADHSQLAFFSGVDPTDFWFFPNRKTVLESVIVEDRDILGLHERVLGKNLSRCIGSCEPSQVGLDQADSQFLRELRSGCGKVRITMTGLCGDSGMWSPGWQLTLTGDSFARLTKSKLAYESAFNSREIIRAVKRTTISSGDFCMAYALGLDNRTLLPPFFPVYHNEDGLFASTLKVCFEGSYVAHLPWAIMHLPEVRMYSGADVWEKPFTHSMFNVVLACLQAFNFPPGTISGEERLRALGHHLMRLGSSNLTAFEEFVRIYLWHLRSTNIKLLEDDLTNRKGAPDFWSRCIAKYIELLQQSLLEEVYRPPKDLLKGRDINEARRLTQRLILRFGELLYWWPEITAAAKNLRADGGRLGATL